MTSGVAACSSIVSSQHAAMQTRLPARQPARPFLTACSARQRRVPATARCSAQSEEKGLPERGSGEASTSGTGLEAGTPLMLTARTAGSTLVFLAAFAALLHSDAALAADPADVSQHHHTANIVFGDIAGEDDFWGNLTSYARFFVTVMLGTVNVVLEPFRKAAKRPGTAVALAFGAVGLFLFMTVTVKLMLGIGDDGDFEYLTRGI